MRLLVEARLVGLVEAARVLLLHGGVGTKQLRMGGLGFSEVETLALCISIAEGRTALKGVVPSLMVSCRRSTLPGFALELLLQSWLCCGCGCSFWASHARAAKLAAAVLGHLLTALVSTT